MNQAAQGPVAGIWYELYIGHRTLLNFNFCIGWVSEWVEASIAKGSLGFDGEADPWAFDEVVKLNVEGKFEIEI